MKTRMLQGHAPLLPLARSVIFSRPDLPRAAAPGDLAAIAREHLGFTGPIAAEPLSRASKTRAMADPPTPSSSPAHSTPSAKPAPILLKLPLDGSSDRTSVTGAVTRALPLAIA